jgi:hypothetical protein
MEHDPVCQYKCELAKQIEDQNIVLRRLEEGQIVIHNALLGSLSTSSVGLIEESRTLRRDVNSISNAIRQQESEIKVNKEEIASFGLFRHDIKRIVAFIAITIPFAFEILKMAFVALWESFAKKGGV